jgi:hypothetical protein
VPFPSVPFPPTTLSREFRYFEPIVRDHQAEFLDRSAASSSLHQLDNVSSSQSVNIRPPFKPGGSALIAAASPRLLAGAKVCASGVECPTTVSLRRLPSGRADPGAKTTRTCLWRCAERLRRAAESGASVSDRRFFNVDSRRAACINLGAACVGVPPATLSSSPSVSSAPCAEDEFAGNSGELAPTNSSSVSEVSFGFVMVGQSLAWHEIPRRRTRY